jgi:hypothetical protein
VHLAGNAASKYNKPPYGMTFFKHATGRICDGRVLIDFYCEYIVTLIYFEEVIRICKGPSKSKLNLLRFMVMSPLSKFVEGIHI